MRNDGTDPWIFKFSRPLTPNSVLAGNAPGHEAGPSTDEVSTKRGVFDTRITEVKTETTDED
jgi:hypothetical protein